MGLVVEVRWYAEVLVRLGVGRMDWVLIVEVTERVRKGLIAVEEVGTRTAGVVVRCLVVRVVRQMIACQQLEHTDLAPWGLAKEAR